MPPCTAAGCGCENFQPQKLIDTKCRICLHWVAQHGPKVTPGPAPRSSPALPTPKPVVRGAVCSCGTSNDPSSAFCVECGTRLVAAPPKSSVPVADSSASAAAEAMRIAKDKAAADQAAVEKMALEREATKKAGAEKLAQAKAEKEAREKAAAERALIEKIAAEKLAIEKAAQEAEQLAREREIAEKLALENAEKERIEREKMAERVAQERVEQLAIEKAVAERAEAEKEERIRAEERHKVERERAEKLALETGHGGPASKTPVSAVSPASNVGDDMPIAEAIKLQLPGRAEKWAGWTTTLEAEDIDTVGDLRRLTQAVWLSLNLSALVRSALEELRSGSHIPSTKPVDSPAGPSARSIDSAAGTPPSTTSSMETPGTSVSALSSVPCATCATPLLKGAVFCGKCGTKTSSAVLCECGVNFLPGAAFCGKCGNAAVVAPPPTELESRNHARTQPFAAVRSVTLDDSPSPTSSAGKPEQPPKSRSRQDQTVSKTQSFSPRILRLDDSTTSKTQAFSPRLLQSNSPASRVPALPKTLPLGVSEDDDVAMASDDSDDDTKIVETGRERRETMASLTSTLSKPFTVTKGTAYGVRQTRVIAIDEQAMTIKFCAQNLTLRSEVPISQFTLAQVNDKRLALSFNKRARIYDLTFADAQECALFIANYQAARRLKPQQSMIVRSSSSVLATDTDNSTPVNHQEYCVIKKNSYNQRQSRIVVLKPKALQLLDGQHKFKKSFPYHHLYSIEVSSTGDDKKGSGENGEAEAFLLFQKSTGQRPFQLFFADAFERAHFSQSVKTLFPSLVLKDGGNNSELRFVVTKLELNAVSSCREGKRRMLEVRVKEGVIRSYDRVKQFKDTHFHAIRSIAPCPLDRSRLYITTRKRFAFDFPDHTSRDRFLALTTPLLDQIKGVSSRKISVFCGTWNMGSSVPTFETNLSQYLPPDSFDVYALGMQECPHSAREAWVTQFRNQIGESKYVLVGSAKLWEISLAVFVRRELAYKVSCREADTVASGVGDVLGNKGAAAVCMRIEDTTICFIGTHLAAQSDKVKERRDDFLKILRCLRFGNKELDVMHYADHVLWLGDLNYRVEMFFYDTVASCEKKDYAELLAHDQLRREMNFPDGYKCVFPNFQEGEITFAPTYRWEKTRNVFSNKKDQSPSYTDRVLWHTSQNDHISLVDYGSAPDVLGSDHRPVFATFTIQPRSFAWARESGSANITLLDVFVTGPQLDETVPLELLVSAPFLPDDVVSVPSAPLQSATTSGRFRREGGFHWEKIVFACPLAPRSSLSQFHLLVTVRVASAGAEKPGFCHGSIALTYQEDKFNCLLTRDGLVLGTLTGAITVD